MAGSDLGFCCSMHMSVSVHVEETLTGQQKGWGLIPGTIHNVHERSPSSWFLHFAIVGYFLLCFYLLSSWVVFIVHRVVPHPLEMEFI